MCFLTVKGATKCKGVFVQAEKIYFHLYHFYTKIFNHNDVVTQLECTNTTNYKQFFMILLFLEFFSCIFHLGVKNFFDFVVWMKNMNMKT